MDGLVHNVDYLEKRFPGKGQEYAEKLRDYTVALYKKCAEYQPLPVM